MSALLSRGRFLEVRVAEPARAAAIIRGLPFVQSVTVQEGTLSVITPEAHAPDIGRALSAAGLYPTAMVPRHESLEDVFLELTEPGSTPEPKGDGD